MDNSSLSLCTTADFTWPNMFFTLQDTVSLDKCIIYILRNFLWTTSFVHVSFMRSAVEWAFWHSESPSVRRKSPLSFGLISSETKTTAMYFFQSLTSRLKKSAGLSIYLGYRFSMWCYSKKLSQITHRGFGQYLSPVNVKSYYTYSTL